MLRLERKSPDNPDFLQLVQALNADLAARDGAEHLLAQYNSVTELQHILVAYWNDTPLGCGAMARKEEKRVEIKRMYVTPAFRGKGYARQILLALEAWAKNEGNESCVLFMGSRQPEAYQLYLSNGYQRIAKYGALKDIPDCICLAKRIVSKKL